MWIYVKTPKEPKAIRFSLHFPQWLALNRPILTAVIRHAKLNMTAEQSGRLLEQLRQTVRRHKKLMVVDVEASDGTKVKIRL